MSLVELTTHAELHLLELCPCTIIGFQGWVFQGRVVVTITSHGDVIVVVTATYEGVVLVITNGYGGRSLNPRC